MSALPMVPLLDADGCPVLGCDFCEESPTPVAVEQIGDKLACAPCAAVPAFAVAPGEDDADDGPTSCSRCFQPFRRLDDGGTLIADTGETLCERCWVAL